MIVLFLMMMTTGVDMSEIGYPVKKWTWYLLSKKVEVELISSKAIKARDKLDILVKYHFNPKCFEDEIFYYVRNKALEE